MMSVVIIEDDPLSSELLIGSLQEARTNVQVSAVLRSVDEAVAFFRTYPAIDLILSDIQLRDGLSFSIFETIQPDCPIIFVSAFDQYIVNAFEYSGIDFLLKPVSKEAIQLAIKKYRSLEKHFNGRNADMRHFMENYLGKRRTRIIVKKGSSFISLPLQQVVCFYTENMVVYACDRAGNKYMVDKNLNALEEELDDTQFFRTNRQYIVNIRYVSGYKTYERVKLLVNLETDNDHVVIVGQEKSKAFRTWLAEA